MRRACLILILVLAGAPRAARAQDAAAADAAFREGRRLLDEGKVAEACARFELSQRLDPAVGTLLNLGRCHALLGRTASAWIAYRDAEAMARRAGQPDRAREAAERAAEMAPQLVRLRILPPPIAPAGLRVTRDGTEVTALLGVAVEVDPGEHTVVAEAPGRDAWRQVVQVVREGATIDVVIPELPRRAVAPRRAAPLTHPPSGGSVADATPAGERDGQAHGWPRRRWLALGTGAAGTLAAGVGLGFGALARSRWSTARSHCDAELRCDETGLAAGRDARGAATVSTVLVGAGLVGLAAGAALWFTTPRGSAVPARVGISPQPGGAQAWIEVTLP